MIKLVVFLGNPGKEYEKTRHNAGYLFFDYLFKGKPTQNKFHSIYYQENDVKYIKPLTFMNLSGTSVAECASFFKIKSDEIMVVHDCIELNSGEIRVQKGGGLAGHKGLRSIKERLGDDSFYRLRIGIGRPKYGDVRLFVTSPFTEDELIGLNQLFSLVEPCFLKCQGNEKWKL